MNGSNKLNLFKEKKIVWEETSSIRISIKRYIYNKLHVYQTNENVLKINICRNNFFSCFTTYNYKIDIISQ